MAQMNRLKEIKMVKRLLFIVLISCTISHAMENDFVVPELFARIRSEHKDGICSQIKHMVHNANRPEVLDEFFLAHVTKSVPSGKAISAVQQRAQRVAKLLADNNVSTCECINHLLEKKRDTALEDIRRAFSLSHTDIENYKQRIAQIEQDCATKSLSIDFVDNGLPVELQQRIYDKARAMGITVPLHVSTSWVIGSHTGKKFPFDRQSPDYILNLNIFDLSESWLAHLHRRFLDTNSNYCRTHGNAVIDHELTHIKTLGMDKYTELVRFITKIENPTEELLIQYENQHPELEQASKAFIKLEKAYESEADRIVPACGVCNDSYNFVVALNAEFEQRCMTNAISNSHHPRVEKRLLWAAVIHWLKVAETE